MSGCNKPSTSALYIDQLNPVYIMQEGTDLLTVQAATLADELELSFHFISDLFTKATAFQDPVCHFKLIMASMCDDGGMELWGAN